MAELPLHSKAPSGYSRLKVSNRDCVCQAVTQTCFICSDFRPKETRLLSTASRAKFRRCCLQTYKSASLIPLIIEP